MKKTSILLLCALTSFGAFAQKSLVEEVEHSIGGFNSDFKAACEKIVPALSNEETKGQAKTWYVAGKACFGLYDNSYSKLQLGQAVDTVLMANSIVKGYDYFMTGLPLDTVREVNKKGKVKIKTKYSKDMVNTLVGHHNDFQLAGSMLYERQKYAEAAKCWEIYASLPYSGIADRDKFMAHDTIIGQIEFYQGVALWQSKDLKGAVNAFANARKHGNLSKDAFDYALFCYAELKDNDGVVALAKEALPIHGDKDSQYLNILINDNINKGNYDEAQKMIEQAIAKQPDSAELYNVMGIMYEQKKDDNKAMECFLKAVELDANHAQGQFNVGRCIMKQAVAVQKKMETLKGADYAAARDNEYLPLLNKALPYMEKAYQLDAENDAAKNILRNIYYQLGDEEKLNALERGY